MPALKHCTICGKSEKEVSRMIAAGEILICDSCAKEVYDGINTVEPGEMVPIKYTPKGLVTKMNDYVIGQDDAKKTVAIAVYNHYKRLNNTKPNAVEIQKSNILMIGPSGTGKTHILKSIAKFFDVPFAIADATSLTEAGYIGDDVESILQRLLQAADYDVSKAERGIVLLDEVDKIAKKSTGASLTRDVSGEGVQQALLKLIEGSKVSVPTTGRKQSGSKSEMIDTTNILFVCAGAFPDLHRIIEHKDSKDKGGIGFGAVVVVDDLSNKKLTVTPEDLIEYGMIPEFVGRLPVVCTLSPLSKEALRSILTEPKDAIVKQFESLFEMDGVQLEVTEEALSTIVEGAYKHKTGARGLRTAIEQSLMEAQYEVPDMVNVTKVILGKDLIVEYVVKKSGT